MPEEYEPPEVSPKTQANNHWLVLAVIVLAITTLASTYYLVQQHREARQLAMGYDEMSAALKQTRGQLEAMSSKLNALTVPQAALPTQSTEIPTAAPAGSNSHSPHKLALRKNAKRIPSEDPRWKQMQSELAEHQKQIDATRQGVEKNRSEFEGKLGSTREELNGSIARTHDELVALQKRGEKNYVEFDLTKSKKFNRVGPLSVSLRKADRKRQFCDLRLIIDDNEITKNHVNLYEPVLLYPADYGQPLEIVINQIERNQARGYVSTPKYRKSELAATSSSGPAESASSASTASLEHRPVTNPQ